MNEDGGQKQNDLLDIVSIGDVVTDDFIRLLDNEAQTYENEQGSWLVMLYGTKLPFDHREVVEGVGNAGNAAVSFARLGLKTGFVTNVGGDQYGRDIINSLGKDKVDTRFVRINPGKKSNYHFVLWYKAERTILIKHEEYDYHWPHLRPSEKPKWVYFSSVSEHAIPYHDQVANWLDENPDVKMAFQPGTFQMEAGTERLQRIYRRSEVLILNREEAVTVGGGNHEDINDLLSRLHALGPKIVVITDGPDGAYASEGDNRFKMPLYPDIAPPYERTGAGDAFASTFVAAILRGNTIEGALQWAPINSMSVVQKVGGQAGLLSERELDEYLRKAPEWYKPQRI
ncbi:MAG TPA: carbohydrate kinase family protein [Candidatus Saccharimonadales bacterium]|jgi:sugar/nucleoside kinase (ribokinase family)|nr:carbohydrate kinase family protein [Candidatus Saccharimonadales bacterium]